MDANNTARVIAGIDLIKNRFKTDLTHDFANRIDPNGYNVVVHALVHNDNINEMRCLMLFKVKNSDHPVEGTVTFYNGTYHKITSIVSLKDGGYLDA